jgi:hypothetical protein
MLSHRPGMTQMASRHLRHFIIASASLRKAWREASRE